MHGGDIYTRKVDLDFSVNINSYGVPERVLEAVKKSLEEAGHYPDIHQTRARKSLATLENVDIESIICGNGASELIMAVTRAVNPRKALIISPGFYGYIHALKSICGSASFQAYDDIVVEYPLREENGFKLEEDILSYIDKVDMIYLTNPHNPTGRLIERDLLEKIIRASYDKGCAVLLDECFLRLTESGESISFKKYVKDFSNLYIIDAFTKLFALPGVRAGYLVSCEENIARVKAQLPEWNLSRASEELLVAGAEEIQRSSFASESLEMIREERAYLRKELTSLGIYVNESDTNYLLIKTGDERIDLYEKLLDRKILIRSAEDFRGLGKDWYRVAVRSHKDNLRLLEAVREEIWNIKNH
ncbi:MAG: aminotransferase class I/II-fold pyridoxal phosphate-dependent enzyme [Eubacterium sp.]|nr:aminotransferase class I/II-fold pyridoxal phosphate-dependent enzyme [Eubacterium sp.]